MIDGNEGNDGNRLHAVLANNAQEYAIHFYSVGLLSRPRNILCNLS